MAADPSDEELREFVASMLSNLERLFQEPEVIDESIRDHREMWLLLYRASLGFDIPDVQSQPGRVFARAGVLDPGGITIRRQGYRGPPDKAELNPRVADPTRQASRLGAEGVRLQLKEAMPLSAEEVETAGLNMSPTSMDSSSRVVLVPW